MKYVATAITGYALMSRDIEVEINEAKLEAALEQERKDQADEDWESWGKPDDEEWLFVETFAENFYVNEEVVEDMAYDILSQWETLPDCVKVRDGDIQQMLSDYETNEPDLKACHQWLRSKGWTKVPNQAEDIWCRKK